MLIEHYFLVGDSNETILLLTATLIEMHGYLLYARKICHIMCDGEPDITKPSVGLKFYNKQVFRRKVIIYMMEAYSIISFFFFTPEQKVSMRESIFCSRQFCQVHSMSMLQCHQF